MIRFSALACMWLAACGGTTTVLTTTPLVPGPLTSAPTTVSLLPSTSAPLTSPQDDSFAGLLNTVRRDAGLAAVTYDSRLDAAAQAHAEDMVARGYYSHVSPEGLGPGDRVATQGYTPARLGENIAPEFPDEPSILAGWQGSPDHRTILLMEGAEDFALGVAGSGRDVRWVMLIGAELP